LFFLLLLLFFFFFCDLSANLGCRSETVKRAARGWLKIQDAKIAKSPSAHNFVGLYLRNESMY